MSLSVCILAHNEARLLPACVGSLRAAGLGGEDRVHILANGCTDQTVLIARTLLAADHRIRLHELVVADKANAWNDYVHRLADPAIQTHVFLDGDVRASENALTALSEALITAPEAYAAAALPIAGRSRRRWARRLLVHNYLSGNLYALSGSAIAAFRKQSLRLPFGAKGEDGVITYLLLTDLKGGADDSHHRRIVMSEGATFEFDSLTVSLRDLRLYQRRLMRYSERHFQKQLLYGLLKREGAGAMPDSIVEIYQAGAVAQLQPRLDPLNYWFDRATLQRLRGGASGALKQA